MSQPKTSENTSSFFNETDYSTFFNNNIRSFKNEEKMSILMKFNDEYQKILDNVEKSSKDTLKKKFENYIE